MAKLWLWYNEKKNQQIMEKKISQPWGKSLWMNFDEHSSMGNKSDDDPRFEN